MTVICFKNGVLASDTQITINGIAAEHWDKVIKTEDGRLIGACGDWPAAVALRDWLVAKDPEKDLEFMPQMGASALVIMPDGEVLSFTSSLTVCRARAPFYALGSGFQIATGAMAAGATAEEAVVIAMKYDVNSGGEIVSVNINDDDNTNVVKLKA